MMRLRSIPICLLALSAFCSAPLCAEESTSICQFKSEVECFESAQCKLVLSGSQMGRYICRSNSNRCEEGFIQRTGTKESCEAKTGCTFQPRNCYCGPEPDVECRCAGGPPPTCRPKDGAMLTNPSIHRPPPPIAAQAGYLHYKGFPVLCKRSDVLSFHA
jgi:hypothetical protein